MPNPVLTGAIDALASGQDLSAQQAADVLAEIMGGDASEAQTAAVLIALRTKGETVEELVATAWGGGVLMAMAHRELPAIGVQFHPESVLTPEGKAMLEAFLA